MRACIFLRRHESGTWPLPKEYDASTDHGRQPARNFSCSDHAQAQAFPELRPFDRLRTGGRFHPFPNRASADRRFGDRITHIKGAAHVAALFVLTHWIVLETLMSRTAVKPFLIAKDESGEYRITVRETRYNSQGYPLVTSTLQADRFKTATAARNFAKAQFGAQADQFASK